MAPIASDGILSVRGSHVAPVSELSQMPPPAPPTSKCLGFWGSTAMLETRPITSIRLLPYVCPFGTSEGPIDCQVDGPGAGGTANALARAFPALVVCRRPPSAVAALTIVAAKDLEAGCVRLSRRAVGAIGRACNAAR